MEQFGIWLVEREMLPRVNESHKRFLELELESRFWAVILTDADILQVSRSDVFALKIILHRKFRDLGRIILLLRLHIYIYKAKGMQLLLSTKLPRFSEL